jgi:hypothetical protein
MEIEIKYQACNLCDAFRNINNNFSVSFGNIKYGDIQTKIILSKTGKKNI